MNLLRKALSILTSQIRQSDVKLGASRKPHKITDDNQSLKNGVINEKSTSGLRSKSKSGAKRGRKPKSVG